MAKAVTGMPSNVKGYVLRVSNPPTTREQLQVAVAHLQGAAIVIVPQRCKSIEEWLARYAPKSDS